MEERKKKFLKVLGAKGAFDVLVYLDEHETAQYRNLMGFVNTPTLNTRLRQLLTFEIISHHLERVETRKEWYELTEKGKEVVKHLKVVMEIVDS